MNFDFCSDFKSWGWTVGSPHLGHFIQGQSPEKYVYLYFLCHLSVVSVEKEFNNKGLLKEKDMTLEM